MTDMMKATIDTCNILTDNQNDFLVAIEKATGLTFMGIAKTPYIMEIWDKKDYE
jgi:hypothetical protein